MSLSTTAHQKNIESMEELLKRFPAQCHIRLEVCNHLVLPYDWEFRDRVNSIFHLAVCKSGEGSYTLGEQRVPLEKGKLIFVSQGFRHERTLNPECLPKMLLARFSMIDNRTLKPVQLKIKPFAFGLALEDQSGFIAEFERVVELFGEKGVSYSRQRSEQLLLDLLYRIHQELLFRQQSPDQDYRLRKAILYLDRHTKGQVRIASASKAAGLSENYFRKLFKEQYGKSPKSYFIEQKMKAARDLLMESQYRIKEIAHMLGFPDPYAFSKQFKIVYGLSPAQVRKHDKDRL